MIKSSDIDVFILCGGEGKRLKKISGDTPKPMVKIGKQPFLDIVIDYLRKFGFKRFILGIGYNAEFIKEYYKKCRIPGVEIVFSQEDAPLGTGGAVKKAKRIIKSQVFFVLNGDSFSEFAPDSFVKFHMKKKAEVSILLRKVENKKDYGAILTDRKSRITCFSEKNPHSLNNYINGGVYLFNKNIFSNMPKKDKFSLEYDFFPGIAGKGLFGYKKAGFFIDIGTPERYWAAEKYFGSGKSFTPSLSLPTRGREIEREK